MIQRLEFDSALFGRPMATLRFDNGDAPDVKGAVESARRDGYKYLICKPALGQLELIRALGDERFYLSDQGITWAIDTGNFAAPASVTADGIVAAAEPDIPALQRMVRSMFVDSRFYNDPFFSTEEADRLHEEWLRNSVTGVAADGVLWLPERGFVTMKTRAGIGEIVLIGVRDAERGRGLGRALLSASMAWFARAGMPRVTVRTQLKNYRANNFYRAHGFAMDSADVAFSRIL